MSETKKYKSQVEWINCDRRSRLPSIIYLEDNLLFSRQWITSAIVLKLRLAWYENPLDLLDDLPLFPESTQFYLDDELGKSLPTGLVVAEKIRSKLNTQIYIVSSHGKDLYSKAIAAGVVNQVFKKELWPFCAGKKLSIQHSPPEEFKGDIAPIKL